MYQNKKIIAMIPARMGSQRLPRKNTALIGGKPLISYAIEAAMACPYFDEIIVNTNDPTVEKITSQYDIKTYNRNENNANSDARSDQVVEEFLKEFPCDVIVWVNTTSPLQPHGEIKAAIDQFFTDSLDSLFTVYEEQVHLNVENTPVNYNPDELFARTQDLKPLKKFVYSVMMWNSDVFFDTLKKTGSALFCGKSGTHSVSKLSSLLIKNKEDLMIADYIALAKNKQSEYDLQYFKD